MKLKAAAFLTLFFLLTIGVRAQQGPPLKLLQKVTIPGLKDGDFDHFAVDLEGQRLFLTAEMNTAVEVFDLRTNKLIHGIPFARPSCRCRWNTGAPCRHAGEPD